MNWFKQQLANVVGTEEPEYGPTAIQPVTNQIAKVPYSTLGKDDLKWRVMETTNVETQTFYFMSDDGTTSMAQLIYSNVGYAALVLLSGLSFFTDTTTEASIRPRNSIPRSGTTMDPENIFGVPVL